MHHFYSLHSINPFRGQTPLMVAAQENQITLVRLLIAAAARINQVDRDGKTALHHAAFRGEREVRERRGFFCLLLRLLFLQVFFLLFFSFFLFIFIFYFYSFFYVFFL